jgi:hypothetical protein
MLDLVEYQQDWHFVDPIMVAWIDGTWSTVI